MLSLRRFNKNDSMSYLEIANDECSYFPFGSCRNLLEAEYVINMYMCYEEIDAYAIIDNGILIGVVYLENCKNIEKNTVLISYFIGEKFCKSGQLLDYYEKVII